MLSAEILPSKQSINYGEAFDDNSRIIFTVLHKDIHFRYSYEVPN